MLTKKGRNIIKEQYLKNPELAQSYQSSHLSCLLKEKDKATEETRLSVSTMVNRKKESTMNSNKDPNYGHKLDICSLFNSYNVVLEKY